MEALRVRLFITVSVKRLIRIECLNCGGLYITGQADGMVVDRKFQLLTSLQHLNKVFLVQFHLSSFQYRASIEQRGLLFENVL